MYDSFRIIYSPFAHASSSFFPIYIFPIIFSNYRINGERHARGNVTLLLNNGKVILFYRLYIYINIKVRSIIRDITSLWIHWKDRDYRLWWRTSPRNGLVPVNYKPGRMQWPILCMRIATPSVILINQPRFPACREHSRSEPFTDLYFPAADARDFHLDKR